MKRRLRICMVAYTFYESDNRVMRYAEALARRGDAVDVISLRRDREPRVGCVEGVNVFRVQSRDYSEQGHLAYALRLLLFFMRAFVLLTRRHWTSPYDVVHVHSVPDCLVFTALVARLTGARVILDIHDLLPEFYASKFGADRRATLFRLMLWIERVSCGFADHVIAANHLWHQKLIARSVAPAQCTVVLNSPDGEIFRRNGVPGSRNGLKVLFPGSLNSHQGVDVAIRAFGRIAAAVPDSRFEIYGNGGDKPRLVELVRELGLHERVLLNPPLPLREVAHVMATADLAVVPKRADGFGNEAFSTKILEFMALGVPVIVSDTAIDRYYFNDEVVTFFRSGEVEDLARQMLALIGDAERRQLQAGRATIFVQRYMWERCRHQYLDIVDRLCGQPAAPAAVSSLSA